MMDFTENIYNQYMYSYPHKTAYRPITFIDLRTYLNKLQGIEETLYFHIPFCETKCGYCNLFSVTGMKESYYNQYIEAMKRQCEQYDLKEDISFKSLVLGGGTPLILNTTQLEAVFDLAKSYCHTDVKNAFAAIETSPNQTDEEKLDFLKAKGMNRISMGVQSFHQEELDTLYRRHTPNQAKEALERIQKHAFDVMNIDLIYGIPGQTMKSLQYSLEAALSYQPDEIFIYPLYVQPHTLLHNKGIKPHPDTYKMYVMVKNYLIEQGYHQTSMRRFTKQYTTTQVSCGFEKTVSIGCGGRSYIEDLHFCNPYARDLKRCRETIDDYIQNKDFMKVMAGYILNQEEQKRRFVIKNLLYHQGIEQQDYMQCFKSRCQEDFPLLTTLKNQSYIKEEDGRLHLTAIGLSLSDAIGPSFISETVACKMATWDETLGVKA